MVTHTYGKGRVVYLAAGFDSAYYLYAYPYQRLVLRQRDRLGGLGSSARRRRSPDVRAFDPDAADKGDYAKRLIVHLFSDLNTTAHHALPNDDVPLREEVVPIHDIGVTFAPAYRFRRIRLEPEGKELKMVRTKTGTRVIVPRLEVHSMVVGELAGDSPR